ncbi:hypothetical protein R1T16_10160 [Flavobacterium sp. DG1-102-2]|uniref:hypothetical protein n=1 Tax=Flavobacterium sp. DG1-102-2 TaxID=3081663 RepID=UPI002949A0E9|nr:hypothetical protein [Flavobacterium sp. DG1-102-2]MDV6168790.1 hypothetical protein [Flavobacterium sp. DG1-102-2]
MKKLIYLFVALCAFTAASAQKISDKDLQGNWKLTSVNMSGITIDLVTGAVVIPEEQKAQLTPDVAAQLDAGMKQAAEQLKNSSASFTGNTVKQNMAGKEKTGTYTLKEEGTNQIMSATWSDASTSDTTVWIKEKKLHISKSGQGQTLELVFVKA